MWKTLDVILREKKAKSQPTYMLQVYKKSVQIWEEGRLRNKKAQIHEMVRF